MHDVIIVGGSFAGLAAANQLGRARRDTLVLDTGLPRNRFASEAHGFLANDGTPPGDILATARRQIAEYESVTHRHGEAIGARVIPDGFALTLADGSTEQARRLVLAFGITDVMPDLPGFAECWGKTVLHCPYCHGYEVRDRRLGLLIRSGMELHIAALFRDWSRHLTFFTDGAPIDDLVREQLSGMGIIVNDATVLALLQRDGIVSHVATADGDVPVDAVFGHAPVRLNSSIGRDLGCEMIDGQMGPLIKVDMRQQTTVPGVFAAGDIAHPAPNISFAVGGGAGAGVFAHQSLVFGL